MFLLVNGMAEQADDDNVLYHPDNVSTPVLFSFRPKSFFGKKKALVRIEDSDWCDRFSLDVAGSSGTVTCRSPDMTYELGVDVQLSHQGLTKQVIFTPYLIVSNLAPFDVQVREHGATDWLTVPSTQSVPFWARTGHKLVILRIADTGQETLPLSYENPASTLLELDNEHGGILVDFQVSESSLIMVCHKYEEGRAPLLLVNHSAARICTRESNALSCQLEAEHACYYTWRKPNSSRTLSWVCGKKEVCKDVFKNGTGSFDEKDPASVRWISFLHGRQRVLLFTNDTQLVEQLLNGTSLQPIDQRVTVSLHGLAVSLVDNVHRREILYAGITSSGVVWETARMNKAALFFRPMSIRDNALLEEAYQQYCLQLEASRLGAVSAARVLDGGRLLVDFNEWKTGKPKERHLRRSYQSGLRCVFESSKWRQQFHVRLNRLQVDNQLDDCVFPIVFAPVPPPRSVASESIPHPFLEMSVVELVDHKNPVRQFHYFKLLVQECHFQVDMSLVNAMAALFMVDGSEFKSENELSKSVQQDIQYAQQGALFFPSFLSFHFFLSLNSWLVKTS